MPVTMQDVARVELGSENYTVLSRLNGHPGAGIAVQLAPGSDALASEADAGSGTPGRSAGIACRSATGCSAAGTRSVREKLPPRAAMARAAANTAIGAA